MKQTICILGACIFSLVDLGLLFKIMHWPGGNINLVLGMSALPIRGRQPAQRHPA